MLMNFVFGLGIVCRGFGLTSCELIVCLPSTLPTRWTPPLDGSFQANPVEGRKLQQSAGDEISSIHFTPFWMMAQPMRFNFGFEFSMKMHWHISPLAFSYASTVRKSVLKNSNFIELHFLDAAREAGWQAGWLAGGGTPRTWKFQIVKMYFIHRLEKAERRIEFCAFDSRCIGGEHFIAHDAVLLRPTRSSSIWNVNHIERNSLSLVIVRFNRRAPSPGSHRRWIIDWLSPPQLGSAKCFNMMFTFASVFILIHRFHSDMSHPFHVAHSLYCISPPRPRVPMMHRKVWSFSSNATFTLDEKYVSDARHGEPRPDGRSNWLDDNADANDRDANHLVTPPAPRIVPQHESHDEPSSPRRSTQRTHTWCDHFLPRNFPFPLSPTLRAEDFWLSWWKDFTNCHFSGSHHSAMAAAVAAASLHPDQDTDPRELEAFAERFKQRRIKLGKYLKEKAASSGELSPSLDFPIRRFRFNSIRVAGRRRAS